MTIRNSRKCFFNGVAVKSLAILGFATMFTACGDDGSNSNSEIEPKIDSDSVVIENKAISGVTQKGPFVNGSSVTVQELGSHSLSQTGNSYEGKIKNDMGEFTVNVERFASRYALLKANGYYRNEVSGEKSKSPLILYALTDLSNRDEVNVNLLTHLAYERSLYLATIDSLSVMKAKKQAESEVFKSFGIEGDFAAAEDLNIFGESDQSAALLAVSVLMQGNLSEGDFSERLANYAADIEEDGVWDDLNTATKIADWANSHWLGSGLAKIRGNITKWNISADVPAFEKYVDNFWLQNYGLESCDSKQEGSVMKNQNAVSANADEYYICKSNSWRVADDIEKDTYRWLDSAAEKHVEKDGDSRYGDVIKTNCYVYEDNLWRNGNENDCSLNLRGCTKKRQDTVGLGFDNVWYICDGKKWRNATDIEKDTASWGEGSFNGEVREGMVSRDAHYIYEADNKSWRVATSMEFDTYDYEKNVKWTAGKDGDSRLGSVNTKNCYVFEDSIWRNGKSSDCSLKLRGCTKLRQDTVGLGSDKVWYICDAKSWRNATTYEKDTFGWKNSTDGTIKKGNVTDSIYVYDKSVWREASVVEAKLGGCVTALADSVGKVGLTYYTCKSNNWREATAIEYDTYKWSAGKDGDSKVGSVNANNCYVFENLAWRIGNVNDCSLGLLGCTAQRENEVQKLDENLYYKCSSKSWTITTNDVDVNTYLYRCTFDENGDNVYKEGDLVYGIYKNKSNYACDDGKWRECDISEEQVGKACTKRLQGLFFNDSVVCDSATWRTINLYDYQNGKVWTNSNLSYGELVDERDGRSYKTIEINGVTVMAENLNYADSNKTGYLKGNNWCYKNDSNNCLKGGRYYSWTAAMDIDSKWQNNVVSASLISNPHQGICPKGWHIPTIKEWSDLFDKSDYAAQQAVGSTLWPNATNESGFSALPTGRHEGVYGFEYIGEFAYFWSADSEELVNAAKELSMTKNDLVTIWTSFKYSGLSVRCIKD